MLAGMGDTVPASADPNGIGYIYRGAPPPVGRTPAAPGCKQTTPVEHVAGYETEVGDFKELRLVFGRAAGGT